MLRLIRTVLLIIVTVLATIFVVQNLATVEVAFLLWAFAAPRAAIFAMIFVAGVVVGLLWSALRTRPAPRAADEPPPIRMPGPDA